MTCQYKAPNIVDGESTDSDGRVSYWTPEVSSDGEQMSITGYKDKGRYKIKEVQILDRVQ
jgi:hypothetical protein